MSVITSQMDLARFVDILNAFVQYGKTRSNGMRAEDSNGDGIKDSYGWHDDNTIENANSSLKRYCVDKLQAAD